MRTGTDSGKKSGQLTGPASANFAEWRRRRSEAIAKPRKSRVTERLEKINREASHSRMKFPKLIHVTIKDDVPNDDPYLWVEEGGVMDAAEVGKSKRVAIYKLHEVGTVIAPPSYVPPKRKGR